MNIILAWFVTFNFINISWIFFRAKEWEDAIKVIKGMFGLNNIGSIDFLQLGYLLTGFCVLLLFKNSIELLRTFKKNIFYMFFTFVLLIISLVQLNRVSEFLYFNF